MSSIPTVTWRQLVERYDGILLDAYGVLVSHDGPYPQAPALLRDLQAAGASYWVVTNDASRLPETIVRQWRQQGLEVDPQRIITSGQQLQKAFVKGALQGAATVVLGPPDSERYVELAGGVVVAPEAKRVDALVIADESGYAFLPAVDAALSACLSAFDAGRQIALLLPNPDLLYPTHSGVGVAAGAVATMFEAIFAERYGASPGGPPRFQRLGKPHAPIFEAAIQRAGSRNLVMVGDQLATDIRGALEAGLDAALVGWGLTDLSALQRLDATQQLAPTYKIPSFTAL